MKVFILLLAVAAVSAAPSAEFQVKNAIDELIRQTFEYARWLLQRHQPYPVPDIPDQRIVDDDLDITFSSSNVRLSNADTFVIDKIANDLPTLHSSYAISIPTAHLEGNFKVTGTGKGKAVTGSGTFVVDVAKLSQSGDIQLEISADHSLQVQSLALDYSIESVKFDVDGLDIEGRTKEEINDFLNNKLLSYLQDNKDTVMAKVSKQVIAKVNPVLEGHSLQDVLNYLKDLVRTTPDPPPNPFQ